MPGTVERHNAAGANRPLLRTAALALLGCLSFVAHGAAADAPSETRPAPALSKADRKKLLAERNGLRKESRELEAQGKYAEAIAVAEKELAIERKEFGDVAANVANTLDVIGHYNVGADDFTAARQAFAEERSILTKVHGEGDWRVTNVRLALSDLETYSRLTAEERGELREAGRIYSRASALYTKGQSRPAAALSEQALATRRRLLGEEHVDTALSLSQLALIEKFLADHAKAETLFKEALAIRSKLLGDHHPTTATSLHNLASLYETMGAYEKAEPLYRQALAIRRDVLGENSSGMAISLNGLALFYKAMGDFEKAEPLYKQAIEIKKKVLGERDPSTATSMANLALLYRSMGDNWKAVALCRKALEIDRSVLGDEHPNTASLIEILGSVYSAMGDYAKAEPLCRESLEIRRKTLGDNHPSTALSLSSLAGIYEATGDDVKAEVLYRQVLEIRKKAFGDKHPEMAASLNSLAGLYVRRGDYAKAEPLYQQAIEIYRKSLGENRAATARTVGNLAMLYKSKKEYAKAEPLYLRAIEIETKTLGEHHPTTANSIHNLAALYDRLGDFEKAKPLYWQALKIMLNTLGAKHPETAAHLENLAMLYRATGDYAMAERLCRQSLEIYEKLFADTLAVQSEQQQLAMATRLRNNLDAYLSIAADAKVRPREVYRHVLMWKGAVFMRQMDGRALRGRSDLKSQFDELESVNVRLSTLALRGSGQNRVVWERQIHELSEQKQSLERQLSQKSARFRELETMKNPPLEYLQQALPPKVVLVDVLQYWHHRPSTEKRGQLVWEQRLLAFIVSRDRPLVEVQLGPVNRLETAIKNWRRAILQDGGTPDEEVVRPVADAKFISAGRTITPQQFLKKAILDRLRKHLEGAEIVLISPDGVLNQVPLAALPGEKAGSYLIEETKLAIVPVPRLLLPHPHSAASKQMASDAKQSLLIMGNVNYGGSPGKTDAVLVAGDSRSAVRGDRDGTLQFASLGFTRAEMDGIRDSFEKDFPDGKVDPLEGEKATESAFRKEAPNCRWLHLATHGFFAPPQVASALAAPKEDKEGSFGEFGKQGIAGFHPGLLSGLAFSGANTRAGGNDDDGILTAVEVAGLDLERTELVVLSACETGLGEVAGGEGVLGLQRAFQLSGAKTTVASLWQIPDRATMQLMQRFYENLWQKKLSKLDALREAQLWMLKGGGQSGSDLKGGRQRGLDVEETGTKKPTSGRLPPKYWAAFTLSGDWR